MANILNIALKKDVFEKLVSGETNEIPIKKNDWWKKRLMDLDTGVYKKFDIASVTCGSTDKFTYEIEKIELRGTKFIITVTLPKDNIVEPDDSDFIWDDNPEDRANDEYIEEVIERQQINPEIIEPVKVNPVVINNGIAEITQTFTLKPDGTLEVSDGKSHYILSEEQKRAIVEKYTKQIQDAEVQQEEVPDVKTRVMKLIDSFCEQKDVFVVNMQNVTIRFNGQIIGYHGGKRLIADRDSDVRIDFKNYELIKYYDMSDDDFILEVQAFLNQLLQNNYVFINKRFCEFYTTTNDELIFKVTAIAKRKYLFNKN